MKSQELWTRLPTDYYDYIVIDEKGINYRLNIEFYSNYKPQVNDIIYVDDSILKEVNLYAFIKGIYNNSLIFKGNLYIFWI